MTNRFTHRLAVAPLVMAAFVAATTHAQAPTVAKAVAPVDVAACQTCHGREGVSANPGVPNLAGQKAAYLEAQLKAFHGKDRKDDVMNAIAAQLSDADIHDLAAYWSSLPATPPPATMAAHGGAAPSAGIPSRMTFPMGFPAGFTVYQTVTEDSGVTKRYANTIALKAAAAGKPLPDGSVILQVSYAATKDGAGAVQSYAGMESRAGWGETVPKLLRNEDWDYALFTADKARRDSLNQAQCLACHKPAEANSYVFTMKALREKAKAAG